MTFEMDQNIRWDQQEGIYRIVLLHGKQHPGCHGNHLRWRTYVATHRLHSPYRCTKYETWKLKTLGVRVRTGTGGQTDGRPVSHNTPRYIYIGRIKKGAKLKLVLHWQNNEGIFRELRRLAQMLCKRMRYSMMQQRWFRELGANQPRTVHSSSVCSTSWDTSTSANDVGWPDQA